MMREAERKRLKRMRYLGDDTREEEGDQEIEEDTVTEDQETTGEVNSEEKDCKIRRKTGKGRRTSSVVRESVKETVVNGEKEKMGPGSFTELSSRCRKPS